MSLFTVVRDVCAVVGVKAPNSVFAGINNNRTMFEMVALANEMAQRIAYDTREWTQQKKQGTFTGDGVATEFNLPADYLRMLTTANVYRSTNMQHPMRFIADTDEWYQRRDWGPGGLYDPLGEWTLLGDKMLIQPVMAVGVTAKFPYLDRNCVVLNAGGLGDHFVDDADTFRLPERLLKLGMVYQWKSQKGSPYAEEMGTFGDALTMLMGSNKPAPILAGRIPLSGSAKVAYPFPSDQSWTWPLH